jgi:hypothetical protein
MIATNRFPLRTGEMVSSTAAHPGSHCGPGHYGDNDALAGRGWMTTEMGASQSIADYGTNSKPDAWHAFDHPAALRPPHGRFPPVVPGLLWAESAGRATAPPFGVLVRSSDDSPVGIQDLARRLTVDWPPA